MQQNSAVEGGPEAGFLVGDFQAAVGPGVTGVEQVVGALGFVEGIILAVAVAHDVLGVALGVEGESALDEGEEPLVLGGAEVDGGALGARRGAVVEGGVHGRGAQPEHGPQGSAGLELRPGRGVEVEALVAPADAHVAQRGVGGGRVGVGQPRGPVHLGRAHGQHQVGVHAVGEDVGPNVAGRGLTATPYRHQREQQRRGHVDKHDANDAADEVGNAFEEFDRRSGLVVQLAYTLRSELPRPPNVISRRGSQRRTQKFTVF